MKYPKQTIKAIEAAKSRKPKERTRCDKIVLMLARKGWATSWDLATGGGGLAFSRRLFELKQQGIAWEKKHSEKAPKGETWYEYRLVEK